MKLVVGLGNPGNGYIGTRHNIGFEIVEKLGVIWQLPRFSSNGKFKSEFSKGQFYGQEIILAKPQAFMNNSGRVVRDILDFFKLTADDLLVIHDDLDIEVGKYKIADDSSSAGHNGVQDIIDHLRTQKFKRMRVGIGKNENIASENYVLQKFTLEEKEKIHQLTDSLIKEADKIIKTPS